MIAFYINILHYNKTMGIKQLNKLIKLYTPLSSVRIDTFKNKTIAIDIMIYMYKYLASDTLLENMYSFCILLTQNNITPLFIFDGEKPKEKQAELDRRRKNRRKAWEKYDHIQNNLDENTNNNIEIQKELYRLKRQCVKIKHTHIKDVKELLKCFGLQYIVAEGEADKLCAEMVIHNKAYACMSDDMDLFMYGCPRVLRLFNIQKKTAILYDLKIILEHLNINHFIDFQVMCVLSGTDYNIEYNKNNIFKIYNKYVYYINRFKSSTGFLTWMTNKTETYNFDKIMKTLELFYIGRTISTHELVENSFMDKINLYKLLEKEYFLNPITVY